MSDQPDRLTALIRRLARLLGTATDALERSYPDGVAQWEAEVARELARYHTAAAMAGAGAELSPALRTRIKRDLAVQLAFLHKFGIAVRSGGAWERGWRSRAESYATGIKVPYWRGRTKLLPLPAMPAEGTGCYGNCGCLWDVQVVDEDAGDYDAYWVRGKDDSCQICVQRAGDWAPVQIRGGVLQL